MLRRFDAECLILSLRRYIDPLLFSVRQENETVQDLYRLCWATDIKTKMPVFETELDRLVEQTDAAVDAIYYIFNTASKHCLNISSSMYESVKEFTYESAKNPELLPTVPISLSRDAVIFIVQMVISELFELLLTVVTSIEDGVSTLHRLFGLEISFDSFIEPTPDFYKEKFGDLVNTIIWFYSSFSNEHIVPCFLEVHEANMRKRGPNGFIHREDGKILKPEGWVGPDLKKIIANS